MSYPLTTVIHDALQYATHVVSKEHAQTIIWWLLESITQQSKLQLLAHHPAISDTHYKELFSALKQHLYEHYPLQYLLQKVPFCGLTICVEPPILIPRPETEQWVHDVITRLTTLPQQPLTILDMCTGTGCIGLALAHALPHATIYLIDISEQALNLAQKNAVYNSINNVHFVQSDMYSNLNDMQFDIIVSNPPYIAEHEYHELSPTVQKWEDKTALVAEQDGLACIATIIQHAHTYLKHNTLLQQHHIPRITIEIGYQQAESVQKLCQDANFDTITISKDLYGNDRIVQCF